MKVYEKIKAYLVANGIDLATVSNSTSIPQKRLSSLLSGEETLYTKELKAICLALNVSPELFIEVQSTFKESKT